MKQSFSPIVLALLTISAGSTALAMPQNFKVIVQNQARAYSGAITLTVTYTYSGKLIKKDVSGGGIVEIPNYSSLTPGTELKFEGAGSMYGNLVNSNAVNVNSLLTEWQKLKPSDEDSKHPLVITVKATGYSPRYPLSMSYSSSVPSEKKPTGKNPFAAFDKIKSYKLEDILNQKRTSFPSISESPLWSEIVVPGLGGLGFGATTAEDVYRYILSLNKTYTKDDVKQAYKDLSIKWHPDKQAGADEEQQTYAAEVFKLVDTAHKGLLIALEDKESQKKETAVK